MMKTKKNVFFIWNMLRFLKHDIKSTMKEKNDNLLDYIKARNS